MACKIGKFDIFATYIYVQQKLAGMDDNSAKVHGFVVAVMGAQAKTGGGGGSFDAVKKSAEKKKKTTITVDNFDRQIVQKLGDFYAQFHYHIYAMVQKGYTYNQVKDIVNIPKTFGAKISSDDFVANASKVI